MGQAAQYSVKKQVGYSSWVGGGMMFSVYIIVCCVCTNTSSVVIAEELWPTNDCAVCVFLHINFPPLTDACR